MPNAPLKKAQKHRYYIKNQERLRAKQKKYREEHRDQVRMINKKYQETHRDKVHGWNNKYNVAHKKEKHSKHLQRSYGISLKDYDALLDAQGGRCLICQTLDSTPHGRFCVDHCHKTGKIRGLLCVRCNSGLGHFKDSPDLLLTAAKYLLGDSH